MTGRVGAGPPFKPCVRISRTRLSRWSSGRRMHAPRILNGTAQAVESQGFEEGTSPAVRPAGAKTTPRALDEQTMEPPLDVGIHLDKLRRRIPGTKVLPPAAQHGVHVRND